MGNEANIFNHCKRSKASLMAQWVKKLPAIRRHRRLMFDPQVGKIPQRKRWQPTPVFLPGESHGQRSLVGYSPKGLKESDTAENPNCESLCCIPIICLILYSNYISI